MKADRLSTVLKAGSLLTLLALNACSGSEEEAEFEFGKADMESALHGRWVGAWTPVNGSPEAFELAIRAPDAPSVRMACGNRTFSQSGPGSSEQCVTETLLSVSATATIARREGDAVDLDGYAITPSRILSQAYLELSREGAPFRLYISWDSGEGFTECGAFADDGAALATCTLQPSR